MFDLVPPMPHHQQQPVYTSHPHSYLPPPQHECKSPSTSTHPPPNMNLYLRQPYTYPTHAVIELVEVAPPPPRRISSVIGSEEGYSESSSSYYESSVESQEEGSDSEGEEGEDEEEGEREEEGDGQGEGGQGGEGEEGWDAQDRDVEGDGEEGCSSYCSSEEDLQQEVEGDETQTTPRRATAPGPTTTATTAAAAAAARSPSDSWKSRWRRILVWRDGALSHSQACSEPSSSSSLKRKLPFASLELSPASDADADDTGAPHPPSSKRSRSSSSSLTSSTTSSFSPANPRRRPHRQRHLTTDPSPSLAYRRYSNTSSITSAELEMHPCPACDAFFPTLQSLRAHGAHGKAVGSEACWGAVEYAFE